MTRAASETLPLNVREKIYNEHLFDKEFVADPKRLAEQCYRLIRSIDLVGYTATRNYLTIHVSQSIKMHLEYQCEANGLGRLIRINILRSINTNKDNDIVLGELRFVTLPVEFPDYPLEYHNNLESYLDGNTNATPAICDNIFMFMFTLFLYLGKWKKTTSDPRWERLAQFVKDGYSLRRGMACTGKGGTKSKSKRHQKDKYTKSHKHVVINNKKHCVYIKNTPDNTQEYIRTTVYKRVPGNAYKK